MDKITHYTISSVKENGLKNEGITFIPINQILFDLGMKQKVDEVCKEKAKISKICISYIFSYL